MIKEQCKFCRDEMCVNSNCPCRADYCPVQQDDYVKICKFAVLEPVPVKSKEDAQELLRSVGILDDDNELIGPYKEILSKRKEEL